MRPRLGLGLGLGLAALVSACASTAPKDVRFSESWPASAGSADSYRETTRTWTRHGRLMSGYDKSLEVWATLESPAWRTAYVARRAKIDGLSPAERSALLAEQKQAHQAHYEVHLRVTTYDRRENNLHRRGRAVWRVALVDDKGRRVEPTTIRRDKRPRSILRTYFPNMDDFAEAYVAQFPRDAQLMGDGTTKLSLRVSSGHGAVELTWRAAR